MSMCAMAQIVPKHFSLPCGCVLMDWGLKQKTDIFRSLSECLFLPIYLHESQCLLTANTQKRTVETEVHSKGKNKRSVMMFDISTLFKTNRKSNEMVESDFCQYCIRQATPLVRDTFWGFSSNAYSMPVARLWNATHRRSVHSTSVSTLPGFSLFRCLNLPVET